VEIESELLSLSYNAMVLSIWLKISLALSQHSSVYAFRRGREAKREIKFLKDTVSHASEEHGKLEVGATEGNCTSSED
jgi:hypothetical protein